MSDDYDDLSGISIDPWQVAKGDPDTPRGPDWHLHEGVGHEHATKLAGTDLGHVPHSHGGGGLPESNLIGELSPTERRDKELYERIVAEQLEEERQERINQIPRILRPIARRVS